MMSKEHDRADGPDDGTGAAHPPPQRTIVLAHDANALPVSAVNNLLLQSSLAGLKEHGFYDRYVERIDPTSLAQLLGNLGPGWVSIDLALAHYEACENLALTPADFARLGEGVGSRVQDALLVALAKKSREPGFDLWQAIGPLHRMWARIYQGGSTQVSKAGPKEMWLESRGYRLYRFPYFRNGQLAALRAIFAAVGTRTTTKLVRYNGARDESIIRVTWA